MHRTFRLIVIAGMAALSPVFPAMAGAKTKIVYAGAPAGAAKQILKTLPPAEGKAVKNAAPGIDGFRITKVTINAGDSVQWLGLAKGGFHTVDLPGSGGHDLQLLTPDPTHPLTGQKDAAGNPFWFNGRPSIGFDPQLFAPLGTHTYNGTSRIDSGLPLGPAKPFAVKFTKPGTYVYFCDVHPGMKGYVVVRPKGKQVPSAKQDAGTLKAELTADIASAVALTKSPVPHNTVDVGKSDGNGVEFYAMFPATLKVKAGTTVTFTMARGSREAHTATFGPANLLNTLANSFAGPAPDPRASYPSDDPALGPIKLSPTLHGNGFANTGLLDEDNTTTFPTSGRITFTHAGTYQFICVVHANMTGTIIVK